MIRFLRRIYAVVCHRAYPFIPLPFCAEAIFWRDYYLPGIQRLRERGFRSIAFWGMGPVVGYEWCTTVFYRDGNCLGL